jgi:hypothetical protein
MNARCETCAFGREGAANEPENALASRLCGLGAIPFYCHHGRLDHVQYDWEGNALGPLGLDPANRKVCAGWQAEVRALKAAGYFPNRAYVAIRRVVARRGIALLRRMFISDIGRGKQNAAKSDLKRCLKFLAKRDIGKENIPL